MVSRKARTLDWANSELITGDVSKEIKRLKEQNGPEEGRLRGELARGTITDKNLVGTMAGKTLADLVALIKEGGAYVNVHTTKNLKGEILQA